MLAIIMKSVLVRGHFTNTHRTSLQSYEFEEFAKSSANAVHGLGKGPVNINLYVNFVRVDSHQARKVFQ